MATPQKPLPRNVQWHKKDAQKSISQAKSIIAPMIEEWKLHELFSAYTKLGEAEHSLRQIAMPQPDPLQDFLTFIKHKARQWLGQLNLQPNF